jgi:phosphoribosylglycinamide formyltransferase-1
VYFVTEQLDGDQVILQAKASIFPGDEEDDVIAQVREQEHTLYLLAVNWFVAGRLVMRKNIAWLDGEYLSEPKRACR